jgi:spore coat protein U-like protein
MKKYLVILAAMMMVVFMVSGAYAANATVSVGASATVTSICNVHDGTLPFGTIDADGTDKTVDAAGGISIQCTTGTSVAVAVGDGLYYSGGHRMADGLGNFLKYSVTNNNPIVGEGATGANIATNSGSTHLVLKGTVLAADASGVKAGIYTDTLVLTLTY